jgi:CHAT domain-containing protein
VARSVLNQAQAMQNLGLYRRAIATLEKLVESLNKQTNSRVYGVALRSLGDALRAIGELESSQKTLQQSLAVAERQGETEDMAAARLSLGNTAAAQGDSLAALEYYRQATTAPTPITLQIQARLDIFRQFIELGQWDDARGLLTELQVRLNQLPQNRVAINARINFALSWLTLASESQENESIPTPTLRAIAQLLAVAKQQASNLGDLRTESFALGSLGELYERAKMWQPAQTLTQQALILAQQSNAPESAYLWQGQLGRILKAQGNQKGAIAAYTNAVTILQSLRSDLVAVNPEVQFSFQQSVEPIYRELVALLLESDGTGEPSQERLEQARGVIESLQLAELDDFLREACLDTRPVTIDAIDRQAAVIYPIVLRDRLEVIVSLPQQTLRHYTIIQPQSQVETVVNRLFQGLATPPVSSSSDDQPLLLRTQKLYDWLIRPAEKDLAASNVKTLVFVLDSILRNIPMAVLHDGERYLVEKYSLALAPGLQLVESQPLQQRQLGVLMAGLSEARDRFEALPDVPIELEKIRAEFPTSSRTLLNQAFTNMAFQSAIKTDSLPIVHLATHGQFGSRLEDTFLLTWDGRLDINQLSGFLRTVESNRRRPIELLVLSACETAAGDARATLGLAGMAVRSGVRSTIATLWQLSDQAAPLLMEKIYRGLLNIETTKAEVLRQAQLSLLKNPSYSHPFFWSSIVLIGNWV